MKNIETDKTIKTIIGVDSCGDGALSGPVVAGAAAFKFDIDSTKKYLMDIGLNDSKKLSPKKRYFIEKEIKKFIIYGKVSIGLYDNTASLIDQIGIKNASLNAMYMAAIRVAHNIEKPMQLNTRLQCVLMVDGIREIPNMDMEQVTIIKGDSKIPEIMIASIIAKCSRDRFMILMSEKYPKYGWAKNKGYGTTKHIAAIREYDLSELHRSTFCQNFRK